MVPPTHKGVATTALKGALFKTIDTCTPSEADTWDSKAGGARFFQEGEKYPTSLISAWKPYGV